jgi:uncharacterized protein HemY
MTMTDVTISVRADKKLHKKMKEMDEVNWSAVIRHAIEMKAYNHPRFVEMLKASKEIDRMRERYGKNKGKTGTEIIREWRDKRQ